MSHFHFKRFTINQSRTTLKVGTDAMLLGAFIKTNSPRFGLDVGAGTGVLSLMVAQNHSSINIDSVEIDSKSFEDLKQNITESVFKNQINFFNIDFFAFQPNKKYDLIFSNPPFYDDGIKFNSEINFHPKHNVNF
jgi:tRNA1Val (adenine37-N6)-methyltransferase